MERQIRVVLLACLVCSSVTGPKCPSGCKLLGLMDKHDHEILKKITRIRTLLEKNQAQYSSTDRISKQTYDYLRDRLTITAGGDNSYYETSQRLRQRIVDMKIKIDRQLKLMSTMKEQIKSQVAEMKRMEVDIDMKLRGCKGSCKTYAEFSVDQASYVALDKQMAQFDTDASQSVGPSRSLYVMKSRLLKHEEGDSKFKSKLDTEQSVVPMFTEQRETGLQSFNRSWAEYRQGFGSVDAQGRGEVWLGNHNLHLLTNQSESVLRVELEDWEGGVAKAQYSVRVGSEEAGFRLEVSNYEGEAGDALGAAGPLMSHSGMRFSTFDRDQDLWGEGSCSELYGGGWWYNNCSAANLNGVYYRGKYRPENNVPYGVENGVVWTPYKPADYSLKREVEGEECWFVPQEVEGEALLLQQEAEVARRMLEVYWELQYVAGANRLARKLRLQGKLSALLSQRLMELRQKVQKQTEELYHTEVDVDMKIRACQGSCSSRLEFRLQKDDYLDLLHAMELQAPAPPASRELPDIAPSAAPHRGQRTQLGLFGDMEENRLVVRTPPLHAEHPDL
ncbi:hypothetical protein NHX12_014136 [Muraenolepis orangiensis]|uniref:Fibrinogen C-terminal domain-containing protein n=1 Tax=Muraenolepis orangiensis TaxID=630683 RepID=A0A9Q0I3H2_9TELE|nr:hypothetical protein NHX12_014136 [Muraenolepis orangiensis]